MGDKFEDLINKPLFEVSYKEKSEVKQDTVQKSAVMPADLYDLKEETNEQFTFGETEEKELKIDNLESIRKQETTEEGIILTHAGISQIETNTHEEERRLIGESRQMHTLSTMGRLKKDMEEQTRTETVMETHKLETAVKSSLSTAETKEIAKNTKEFLEQFWELKEALASDPVLNTEEKARMLYNFAKPYASDMKKYKELYVSGLVKGKRLDDINMYLERFEGLMEYFRQLDAGEKPNGVLLTVLGLRKGSVHYELFQGDTDILTRAKQRAKQKDSYVAQKVMAEKIKSGKKLQAQKKGQAPALDASMQKEDPDATLSEEQMKGVRSADAWLVKLGISSQKRLPFISTLMALSMRERLFMYRLIEEGHLESPKFNDVAISQTDYIPDVKKISRIMYRVPFRLWEKLSNEGMVQHHWEKLESALQIVKQQGVSETIGKFAAVQKKENEEAKNGAATKNEENIFEQRNTLIDEAIKACKEYEEAQKTADSAWVYKERKANAAAEKQKAAIEALKALEVVDKKIESKYTEGSDFKEYSMYASGQALGLMAKLGSVTKLMQPVITASLKSASAAGDTAKIGQIHKGLDAANLASGALVTAKGVHTLISSLGAIKKTYNAIATGDIALSDSLLMGAQAGYGLVAGITSTTIGFVNIEYAKMTTDLMMGSKEVKGAIDSMKSGVRKANVALAVGSLTLNAADGLVQLKHRHSYDKAETVMEYMESTGELKGDDKLFLENTKKLQKRNMDRKAVGTAFSAATNLGTLGAAFLGPAGTLAWGGISLGLSIATKLSDYLLKDRSTKKTAEEFFNLIDIEDLLQMEDEKDDNRRAFKERALRDLKESKTKQKELKESLLLHMSATLGFTSFKSLFKNIIGKYAAFLHRCLFYHDDRLITEKHKDDYPMSVASAELIKSMGLKVRYPVVENEAYADQYWHPSLRMIAAKLGA